MGSERSSFVRCILGGRFLCLSPNMSKALSATLPLAWQESSFCISALQAGSQWRRCPDTIISPLPTATPAWGGGVRTHAGLCLPPASGASDLTAGRRISLIAPWFFSLCHILGMFDFIAGESQARRHGHWVSRCEDDFRADRLKLRESEGRLGSFSSRKVPTREKGHGLHFQEEMRKPSNS